MAVDIATATTTATYGNEALTNGTTLNNGTALTLGATIVTLGAEYTENDTITITLDGAKFIKTENFALTHDRAGGAQIVFGFLGATDNTLLFRVTGTTAATSGLALRLDAGTYSPITGSVVAATENKIILDSTAVGAKVSISAAGATNGGQAMDVAGSDDTFEVGSVIQQHKFTVATADAMAAKIDVAKERKEFSGETGEEANFILTYDEVTPTQGDFAATDVKYTINGSFAGFEKTVAATDNDGEIFIDLTTDLPLTVAADLQSASISISGAITASKILQFNVDTVAANREILNISSYTVDTLLTSASAQTNYTGLAAGSATLNGASAQFAYVPVNFAGAVVSQFEIGNKGTVDGDITLSGFDSAGVQYSKTITKKAEAGKLTKLSDLDISEAFELTAGTKLNLTITINAPKDDVTFAGYSNRGTTGRMAINQVN